MGKETLFDNVKSRLQELDEKQCEIVAHSVLNHLWRRLPFAERQNVLEVMPADLTELARNPADPSKPELSVEEREREGPIEHGTYEDFVDAVRAEAGIRTEKDYEGKDREAVQAVFLALKRELTEKEAGNIEEMLPAGLKEIWGGA